MIKTENSMIQTSPFRILKFGFESFEFVSDFDIRISDFFSLGSWRDKFSRNLFVYHFKGKNLKEAKQCDPKFGM